MIAAERLDTLLNGLAAAFEDVEKRDPGLPSARGWGQFLDGSTSNRQVGLYGTSAGILVRALAGRGASRLTEESHGLVQHWWRVRESDLEIKRSLGQTLRLAFLNLALRLSGPDQGGGLGREVEDELLGRLLPSSMWGDFWFPDLQDQTPRLFPSAVALLSLTILLGSGAVDQRLARVADQLEVRLLGNDRLPLLHSATAAAAILCARQQSLDHKFRQVLSGVAYKGSAGMADLGVYFYDYDYVGAGSLRESGRDYFIVPVEMMVAIAGFQPGAPGPLRLRAEAGTCLLVGNLERHGGKYQPDSEQRVSSKNQAWAALLLRLAASRHAPVSRWEKVWYELRRTRQETWFTLWAMPLLCVMDIVMAQLALDLSPRWQSFALKALAPVLALLTGKLYLRGIFVSLFPGRQW